MDMSDLLTKFEIMELRLAYAAHFDSRDFVRFAALFTEDAVCSFGAEYGGDWVGRETITQRFIERGRIGGGPFDVIHVVTNPWITLAGADRAHGRWYLLDYLTRQKPHTGLESRGGHDNPLLWLGLYEDDYRREDGAWKIERVRLQFLWPKRSGDA
jgi:hypothetical protein